MNKRRLLLLYFSPEKPTYELIKKYAEATGVSVTKAIWELVERGLERTKEAE